jgi:hypothetical protein
MPVDQNFSFFVFDPTFYCLGSLLKAKIPLIWLKIRKVIKKSRGTVSLSFGEVGAICFVP